MRINKILPVLLWISVSFASAEDGAKAWLRYEPVSKVLYKNLPSEIVVTGHSVTEKLAGEELRNGLSSMLGRPFSLHVGPDVKSHAIVIGPSREMLPSEPVQNKPDSFEIDVHHEENGDHVIIRGNTPQAELYAVFRLLMEVGAERMIPNHQRERASAEIRWTDEWDNMDGSIERGYAGRSIFFERGHVRKDLSRAAAYARLLASVGINGCTINNVNADLDLLTSEHLHEFARVADVFRPWGVRLALSVDLASPQFVGGIDSYDPADARVVAWWKQKADEIYTMIPDFAGFTVKADSEGRKGPAQYGRNPADAANVLARALAPHGGVVLYRGFVYNNHLDWNDAKADRARAGVDNFARYDGDFDPNVVVQIKEGPIDFQAREPVSPLFAALTHTNVAIELQTTQEYTGQQRHMVWLPSMWKWVLDTDLRAENRATPVREIVTGHSFALPNGKPRLGGFISVTNVGMETNWLHHPMALANLYGFGRLAWNPNLALEDIIDEWTRLTWGNDAKVDAAVNAMQLKSWRVYEGYTGPNGIGTLTNILGYHFGPDIESAEHNGWGQWLRADTRAIGMERGIRGTGYIQQYPPQLAARYEDLATCPDDLLLFFHHTPYDARLHNGKTLVQSIYDTHYESAREAADYERRWLELKGRIDDERFEQVLALFRFQAGHAQLWRDAMNDWFHRIAGIEDVHHRVGNHVNRLEAEAMQATGYQPRVITPWETASGGTVMECKVTAGCTLATTLDKAAGDYSISVAYYDTWRGVSEFELLLNGTVVAHWHARDTLPPAQFDPLPDGQTATRFTAYGIYIKPGDKLVLHAIPDLRTELVEPSQDFREYAIVDFLEVVPERSTSTAAGKDTTAP